MESSILYHLDRTGILGIDILTALLAIVPLLFIDVPQPAALAQRSAGERRSLIRETVVCLLGKAE